MTGTGRDRDVIVVGGGPAGLTAALAAARRGLSVTVLEAGPRMGGLSAGLTLFGQRVDLGSHRLHPAASPRVLDLIGGLLGDDLQVRPRRGRLRLGDRWVRFPLDPVDLVATASPRFAAAAARDLVTAPLRRPDADSYAEVIRAGLGPAAFDAFHRPMAAKLWGVDPEVLSGELARRRVPVRSGGALLTRLAAGARRGRRAPTFLYPRLGYGQIVDAVAAAARSAGAELITDAAVGSVEPDASGATVAWSSRSAASSTGVGILRAGRVLWTAGPEVLARVLPDAATGWVPGAAAPGAAAPGDGRSPTYRGLVLVYLCVADPPYTRFDAHYVADPEVPFARLSEPRNYRHGPDPIDRTVLCAEIPASVGDRWWRASADDLAEAVIDGLVRLDLPRPRLLGVEVVRLPRVYPVLRVGDDVARRHRLDTLARVDGVTLVGRQARLVADNLHHVLDMALSAVDCVGPDGTWDAAEWARAERRFESFTVED